MAKFIQASSTYSYGSSTVLLEWTLDVPHEGYAVSIYRSPDGIGDWTLITPEAAGVTGGRFEDKSFRLPDMAQQLTYRLDLEPVNSNGDVADVLHSVLATPSEYLSLGARDRRTVRGMVMAEITRLKRGAGVPCWLLAPLKNPTTRSVYEQLTGLRAAVGCKNDDANLANYFTHPFQTWVQLKQQVNRMERTQDGEGIEEEVKLTARLPGYPVPRSYYLLVLPDSDRRFLLDTVQQAFLYRGVVPVCYDVSLIELNRTDPHYRLVMPPLDRRLNFPA